MYNETRGLVNIAIMLNIGRNMNNVLIRQALLSDLNALVPLFDSYRQFYDRESDLDAAREFLKARFSHSESVIFIAIAGESAVGFVQLYPSFSSVSLARTFILNDLYVSPEVRRCGVANQLIRAAVEYAGSLGAIRLTLSTAMTNEPAQLLYQSSGWQRDQQFYVYHYPVPA
jgi:ribosomal protein S18 acetylase RimI-like enzyme